MSINKNRLVVTGLVAGFVISLSALSMVPVVGNEMDTILASRGVPPLSTWAMVFFCSLSFVYGFALTLLYALLKDPLGQGIKTALKISLSFWFVVYFLGNASKIAYGFMPVKFTMLGTAWGLGELILAAFVISYLYKDSERIVSN